MQFSFIILTLAVASVSASSSGTAKQQLAYGICRTVFFAHPGCNKYAATCYNIAGRVFGTVKTDKNTPTDILKCNAALGVCQKWCAKAVIKFGSTKA